MTTTPLPLTAPPTALCSHPTPEEVKITNPTERRSKICVWSPERGERDQRVAA